MKTIALFILLLMPFSGIAQSYFNIDQPIARVDFEVDEKANDRVKITVTLNQETRETAEVRKLIDKIKITKVTGNVQWENSATADSELEGGRFYEDPNEYVWSSQLKLTVNQQYLRTKGDNSNWKRLTNVQVTYVIDDANEYQTPYLNIEKCALLGIDDKVVKLQSSSTIYYNSQQQYTFKFNVDVPNTPFVVKSVILQEKGVVQNELLTFQNQTHRYNSFTGAEIELKLAPNSGVIPNNQKEYTLKAVVFLPTYNRNLILEKVVTLQLKDEPKIILITDPDGKTVEHLNNFEVRINDEKHYSFVIALKNAEGITANDIKLEYIPKNKSLNIKAGALGDGKFNITISKLENLEETETVYFTFKIKGKLLPNVAHILHKNKAVVVSNYAIFMDSELKQSAFTNPRLISEFNLPAWVEKNAVSYQTDLRVTIEGADVEFVVKWNSDQKKFIGTLPTSSYADLKTDAEEQIIERKILIKFKGETIYTLGVKFLNYGKINDLLDQLNTEVKEKRQDRDEVKITNILKAIASYAGKLEEATESDLITNAVSELANGNARREEDAKKVLNTIKEVAGWVGKFLPFAIALI